MYYKINSGKFKGLVGTYKGRLGARFVLCVQSRDQWCLAIEKPKDISVVKRWELVICNGTNYIVEVL
jgi:hypothetical protein